MTLLPGSASVLAPPADTVNGPVPAAYASGWKRTVPSAVVRRLTSVPSPATTTSARAAGRPLSPVTVTTMRPVGSTSRTGIPRPKKSAR